MADRREARTRDQVREHYAAAATAVTTGTASTVTAAGGTVEASCCAGSDTRLPTADAGQTGQTGGCCDPGVSVQPGFGAALYPDAERDLLPADAVAASLGCGNPLAVAELREGETVLDLGSGGGIDVLLSARRVGPAGKAYGLDMTAEMLALAERNAAAADVTNVEFLQGYLESIPLPDQTVDVVISNCVINLSTDKTAVFTETHRVLRAGGRIGISDVVAADHLSPAERAERGGHTDCIAGALTTREYREGLTAAGFTDIEITLTHQVADAMHSAIIHATKPAR
jgi:SAM-dependent methyltransferase